MYIVLRGQVTIFIQYANKTEDVDDRSTKPKQEPPKSDQTGPPGVPEDTESARKRLGTYVCSLGRCEVIYPYYMHMKHCSTIWGEFERRRNGEECSSIERERGEREEREKF